MVNNIDNLFLKLGIALMGLMFAIVFIQAILSIVKVSKIKYKK